MQKIGEYVIRGGRTALSHFFPRQEEALVKELIEDSNQTVEVEDYAITL